MRKIALLFIAAVLGVAPAYSQTQRPDYLTPEDSTLSGGDSMFSAKYYSLVTDVLAEGYTGSVSLRAVVLPSFWPEYLVGLRNTGEGKDVGHRVFYLRPTIHLSDYETLRMLQTGEMKFSGAKYSDDWNSVKFEDPTKARADWINQLKSRLPVNPKDVPLARCERPLDPTVAQHITTAWIGALRETRHPPGYPGLRLDGIGYHFSADLQWEGVITDRILFKSIIAGQTWSPPRDSKPGKLAELADTLVQYCDGKAEATELQKQADALVERLGK